MFYLKINVRKWEGNIFKVFGKYTNIENLNFSEENHHLAHKFIIRFPSITIFEIKLHLCTQLWKAGYNIR